jgi:hypothetical protein
MAAKSTRQPFSGRKVLERALRAKARGRFDG